MSEDKISDQFITIKEACLLTGKSSVTIRRLQGGIIPLPTIE